MKLTKFNYLNSSNKNKNQSIILNEGEIIHILVNKRPQTEKIFICENEEILEITKEAYKTKIKKDYKPSNLTD